MKRLLEAHGVRVAAALVAAAALGGALYRVPALERIGHRFLNAPGNSVTSADVDPLKYYVSIGALESARAEIPSGQTYTVVVGRDPPLGATPADQAAAAHAIRVMFLMYLMPRRYTTDLHKARWVVAYHEATPKLHVSVSKQSYLSYEANLIEVAR